MEQIIYYDKDGKPYVLDEVGNKMPPLQLPASHMKESGGFHYFDTDQGHCAFCGRLTCKGYCFK